MARRERSHRIERVSCDSGLPSIQQCDVEYYQRNLFGEKGSEPIGRDISAQRLSV